MGDHSNLKMLSSEICLLLEERNCFAREQIFYLSRSPFFRQTLGWLGEMKVSCILSRRGVQLLLACNWARLAVRAAGKGRRGMLLFLLFLPFYSFSSFCSVPSLSSYLLSLFSLSLGDNTKWPTRVDVLLNHNTISQSIQMDFIYQESKFLSLEGICLWKERQRFCLYALNVSIQYISREATFQNCF